MTRPEIDVARRTNRLSVVLHVSAALGVGAIVAWTWLILPSLVGIPGLFAAWVAESGGEPSRFGELGSVVILVVAGMAVVVVGAMREHVGSSARVMAIGWLLSAASAAALAVFAPVVTLPALVAAALAGLVLGGGLVALASATPLVQRVGVVALAAGVIGGFSVPGLPIGGSIRIIPAVAAGLAVIAGLVALRASVAPIGSTAPGRPAPGATRPWGPVVVVGVVGVVAWLIDNGRRAVATTMVDDLTSERRVAFIERADRITLVGTVAVIAIALAWYGYLRGGRDLARWTVVGIAIAVPWALLPSVWIAPARGSFAPALVITALTIAAAAAAGGCAAWFVGRRVPWDVFGVLAAAALTLWVALAREFPHVEEGWWTSIPLATVTLMLAAVTVFAGAAGVVRLPRGQLGTSMLLGLAALLYSAPIWRSWLAPGWDRPGSGGAPVGVMVAAAVVLVALFGLGLVVDRIRRDIKAEAAAPWQ